MSNNFSSNEKYGFNAEFIELLSKFNSKLIYHAYMYRTFLPGQFGVLIF